MSDENDVPTGELTAPQTADLLRRILADVEKDQQRRWTEIACAVVLSLATTASAWCAYQSTLWAGVQTFRLADAGAAGRESSEAAVVAIQARSFDAAVFIQYIEAKHAANDRHETFLYERFRPEMRKAVDAWLKTDPFNNPSAPPSPFTMAEYSQKELAEVDRQDAQAAGARAAAQTANETADRYVLLTVIFASVLFFGGIGNTFRSHWGRRGSLAMSYALFLATMVALCMMPICRS
jgi:hypothetical protein